MVHTLHICAYDNEARLWSLVPDACVTAVSDYQWSAYPHLRPAAVIPHGVDPEQFTATDQAQDYLCYLGRFTPGKGPLQAIATARALGLRLVLAGPPDAYYREHVAPLVDGRQVQYAGYVSGRARNQLLGGARALLYPLQKPEPFGLVQVEAMMCGTPVVALRRGAVPEIIEEGVTGYSADTGEEFAGQVLRSFTLDRRRVRRRAEQRFSARHMARQYGDLYQRIAGTPSGRNGPWRPSW
jgi:glycosyltransferase involved in cell wall biosynthesis